MPKYKVNIARIKQDLDVVSKPTYGQTTNAALEYSTQSGVDYCQVELDGYCIATAMNGQLKVVDELTKLA